MSANQQLFITGETTAAGTNDLQVQDHKSHRCPQHRLPVLWYLNFQSLSFIQLFYTLFLDLKPYTAVSHSSLLADNLHHWFINTVSHHSVWFFSWLQSTGTVWMPPYTHIKPGVVWRSRESLSAEKEKKEASMQRCQDKKWRESG